VTCQPDPAAVLPGIVQNPATQSLHLTHNTRHVLSWAPEEYKKTFVAFIPRTIWKINGYVVTIKYVDVNQMGNRVTKKESRCIIVLSLEKI
jgi:hypothetical protein